MSINLSLGDMFEQVWGYKTTAFDPEFPKVPTRKELGTHGAPYYAKDLLGREYFLPVTFTYPDQTKVSTQDAALLGSSDLGILKKWDLPYPIVSIESRKTIVETALTERRGTVKQLINLQDYNINIKGFIIGANRQFPEEDINTLRTIYEVNASISMSNVLTDIFLFRPERNGSDQVVITSLKLLEVRGIKNVRPYELTLLSDEPFDLIAIK